MSPIRESFILWRVRRRIRYFEKILTYKFYPFGEDCDLVVDADDTYPERQWLYLEIHRLKMLDSRIVVRRKRRIILGYGS